MRENVKIKHICFHYVKEVNKWQIKSFFQLSSNPSNYVYYVILTFILMYNIIY
jgi:malate/lactate dehydrogenase